MDKTQNYIHKTKKKVQNQWTNRQSTRLKTTNNLKDGRLGFPSLELDSAQQS